MKWKLWLLVTACGSLAIITGYLALTFVEQRAAVTAGGFASAQEMALLHRLGYGTKAEYLVYLEQYKEKERKEKQSKEQLEEKARVEEHDRLAKIADLDRRIQNLPRDIVGSITGEEVAWVEKAAQFKLACEVASGIERKAIVLGAKAGLFRKSKINEMVQIDSSSFATLELFSPVRWRDSTGVCRAWFNVDGVYNGIRYRAYYYGVVSSFRKNEDGVINVSAFDDRFHFSNVIE